MLALARVALARPGRQEQQEARVAAGAYLVARLRLEVRDEAGAAGDGRPVLLELHLARGKVDDDRPRLGIGAKHRRLMRRHVKRGEVPGLHAREDTSAGILARVLMA